MTYRPATGDAVVERVRARDPGETDARRALAGAPDRIDLATALARAEIRRARESADPRFLGQAQAALARWWHLRNPPREVLFLRAVIRQSLHDFTGARADLDQLVALAPDDAEAHLTRAVVATVTADYAAAHESCAALERRASPLVAAACRAPLEGIAGDAEGAYARLAGSLAGERPGARLRGWVLAQLAELAIMRGDDPGAEQHLAAALDLDREDAYARDALADVLLATGRAAEASALLEGREAIDSHLVRRAIAEHQAHGAEAARLAGAMRRRIAAEAVRGDALHRRDEARFTLVVDAEPARAARLALANWHIQKELADARLLAEAAVAATDPEAASVVLVWARRTGVRDAQLERALARLESSP